MKFYHIFLLALTSALVFSCAVEPSEIDYGNIHCAHCDMTVVDRSHSAQYVTKKGKAYMFDAVECLIQKVAVEKNEDILAFILVADYTNPGTLVDAKSATFMINEKIKSPMGANLSAFSTFEVANKVKELEGGELFNWTEIKSKLSN